MTASKTKQLNAFKEIEGLIAIGKARYVTLEEADGLLWPEHRKWLEYLIAAFVKQGYSLQWKGVDMLDYGVPQKGRRRVVVIASW